MADTSMSNRSIAEAMGLYFGKEYIEFLHDVAHVLPNTVVHEDEKCRISGDFSPTALSNGLRRIKPGVSQAVSYLASCASSRSGVSPS